MSIRPIEFNPDGSLEVFHDEMGHGGTVQPGDLQWGKRLDGTNDLRTMRIPCPVPGCNSETLHPVSGGAAPEAIQRLFVRRLQTLAPGRSWAQAKALARVMIQQQDGLDRFKLSDVLSEKD